MKAEEGKRLLRSASHCHIVIHCPAIRKKEIKPQYCPEDEAKALVEGGTKDKSYFGERWRRQTKSILNKEKELLP